MASTDPNRARLLRELVSDPDPEAAKFGREQLKEELEHQRSVERGLLKTEQIVLAGVAILVLVIMGASVAVGLLTGAGVAAVIALGTEVIGVCGAVAARSYWGAQQSGQTALRSDANDLLIEE